MSTAARLKLIDEGDFRSLFVEELGWDRPTLKPFVAEVDEQRFELTEVAGFSGIRVWVCNALPDQRVQRAIDAQVRKISEARLLIFTDGTSQEWRWLQSPDANGAGQPRLTTHRHYVGSSNQALLQRLANIEISMSETPSLIEVLRRMRSAFDADVVTRRFYDQFVRKQQDLTDAIVGIPDEADRDWYAALVMNRLMFIYFMQKKSFMDNDADYLRTRLNRIRDLVGDGQFYGFYRDFLIPMFHSGLGAKNSSYDDPIITDLVGDVPYINGGIFSLHPLERANEITIPDDTFESIFNLFDRFQWHLDDRPNASGNEINPDVLGYIFEQFVNQKESQDDKGAYYTKEDVTHFMVSNTLIPVFLERLQDRTGCDPWSYVQRSPERYIWQSLGWGVERPFPDEVEAERGDTERPTWGHVATEDIGLPGETWWEADRRRNEYAHVREAAVSGGIADVNQAVSENIDLEVLAIDVIDDLSPSDAMVAWDILSEIRVIDPTCGSGAFLFAALRILEPLYEATLDAVRRPTDTRPAEASALLARIDDHANQSYFVLKHSTLSNIYGVDIMHEAVEIARLRLFLKLVATIDDRADLEPLPDLDFNIKAGNSLVGALDETDFAKVEDLLNASRVAEVHRTANRISAKFDEYRSAQEADDIDVLHALRDELTELLDSGRVEANALYHETAEIDGDLATWVESHTPFHWYIEFPGVFSDGGFDVVIGNPPYVAKTDVDYTYKGFKTDNLSDIYAPCCERAAGITKRGGRLSLIVPVSSQFGKEYEPLRAVYSKRFSSVWVSAFQERPSRLFQVKVRSSILTAAGYGAEDADIHTTLTHSWIEPYRPHLFATLRYARRPADTRTPYWMRSSGPRMFELLDTMSALGTVSSALVRTSEFCVGWKKTATYFLTTYTIPPVTYSLATHAPSPLNEGRLHTQNRKDQLALAAVLSSRLAFLWWTFTGDCFNVTKTTMTAFPFSLRNCKPESYAELVRIGERLELALEEARTWDLNSGKLVGGYAVNELRPISDRADEVILESVGMLDYLPEVQFAHARMYKSTGVSSTTVRTLPFEV
jgi:hypothetical protein